MKQSAGFRMLAQVAVAVLLMQIWIAPPPSRAGMTSQQKMMEMMKRKASRANWKVLEKSASALAKEIERAGANPRMMKKVMSADSASDLPGPLGAAVTDYLERYIKMTGERNALKATQMSMAVLLADSQSDLEAHAIRLQENLSRKGELRTTIALFRFAIDDWPEGVETQEFTWSDADGQLQTRMLTKEQVKEQLRSCESELSSLSDMTEMMQMDLQQAQQRYTQALQMISNLTKSFHDTAKSIIQNLR